VLHLVVNPVAGGGRALTALPTLRERLKAAGLEHDVHVTNAPGDATDIVRALPNDGSVVAVGGDGTVHEVIASLNGSRRTFGVVPLGSGDDFARGLGLHLGGIDQAVKVLAAGATRLIDAAEVSLPGQPSSLYACGFGTGFDAQVARKAAHDTPKFLRGLPRYLWAVFAQLSGLTLHDLKVTADGKVVHDGPALLAAAMTMPSYGGGLKIAPHARPDDGLLDLVIGGRFSKAGALAVLPRVAFGTHLGHPQVRVHRVREASFEWAQAMPAQTDGELLGPSLHYSVRVLPAALRVIAPA
jgi:diacylglycerol kinase (ATP)